MLEGISSYILPVLKLLGLLLTAFFAISQHFREQDKSPELERRNRRWSITAILLSLTVAASAELIGVILKKEEATNAAKRAAESAEQTRQIVSDLDRSLHPLFPIKIKPGFRVELRHPSLASFRERLINAIPADKDVAPLVLAPSTPQFPNRNLEPEAYGLLTADPQVKVFIVRHPTDPPVSIDKEVVDLSFDLKTTLPRPPVPAGGKVSPRVKIDKDYGYSKEGFVTIGFPSETINVSDCFSKGTIVSPSDLVGSRMFIEIEPIMEGLKVAVSVPDEGPSDPADLRKLGESFEIDWLDIELPGIQEFQLHKKDFERVTFDHRSFFIYTFPKTKEALSKMFFD
jgi:hypothetical protein